MANWRFVKEAGEPPSYAFPWQGFHVQVHAQHEPASPSIFIGIFFYAQEILIPFKVINKKVVRCITSKIWQRGTLRTQTEDGKCVELGGARVWAAAGNPRQPARTASGTWMEVEQGEGQPQPAVGLQSCCLQAPGNLLPLSTGRAAGWILRASYPSKQSQPHNLWGLVQNESRSCLFKCYEEF